MQCLDVGPLSSTSSSLSVRSFRRSHVDFKVATSPSHIYSQLAAWMFPPSSTDTDKFIPCAFLGPFSGAMTKYLCGGHYKQWKVALFTVLKVEKSKNMELEVSASCEDPGWYHQEGEVSLGETEQAASSSSF